MCGLHADRKICPMGSPLGFTKKKILMPNSDRQDENFIHSPTPIKDSYKFVYILLIYEESTIHDMLLLT